MVLHENKQEPVAEGGMIEPQPGQMWTAHNRWMEDSTYVLIELQKADTGYDLWTFRAFDITHKNMTSVYFNVGNYHMWERLA